MSTRGGSDGRDGPVGADRIVEPAARTAGVLLAALALTVLAAWFAGPEWVERLSPGRATMKVNTAVASLAIAVTILVRRTWVVALLCAAVAAVALASLAEYIFDLRLGLDEALVQDTVTRAAYAPGRMAPVTAVAILLLTVARWTAHRGSGRTADLLCLVPLAVGALALLGYLFQVESFFTVVAFSTVALPSALALTLLSVGVACTVPGGAAWWVARDTGAGATLVRHMLPVAAVVLPLLGVLPVVGIDLRLFGPRFGIAVLVAVSAGVLLTVAVVAARRLDLIDQERLEAEAQLRQLNEELELRRHAETERAETLSRDLADERARFKRAIGKVDDLIWTVEVMRDGTLRPEFSSGDASGLFGADRRTEEDGDDDLALAIAKLVHPDDRQLLEAFDDRVRAGKPSDTEIRVVGYDGAVRWVWLRGTPRRERSQLFFDGISTNVTERRELAERRENLLTLEQEQVRRLRQLNQLRDELLAVTGHELRTPLAVVRGYAELLLQDSDLTEPQRKHLEIVANRARQITLLVDDIFDLAKFSAGLESIDARPVALDEAVTRVVADHRPAADGAGLVIDVDVTPMTVAADPARLRQILDNLLSNAIKYSLPGGHVRVGAHAHGALATITVSDAGIGIPETELEHVFDKMYRASSAKDRDIKGTGLGLSVAKALVEAHRGTISVVNRPEGGTLFTVALPLQAVATEETAPTARVHV